MGAFRHRISPATPQVIRYNHHTNSDDAQSSNPLVGHFAADTFDTLIGCVTFLQEALFIRGKEPDPLSDTATTGAFQLMLCIIDALERQREELFVERTLGDPGGGMGNLAPSCAAERIVSDLVAAGTELSDLCECSQWFSHQLAAAVVRSGKHVDDFTVGEMRALIQREKALVGGQASC